MDNTAIRAYVEKDTGLIPCSRYVNRYGDGLADLVIAIADIFEDATGEPTTYEALDHIISQVVNDADDIATLLVEHGPCAGIIASDFLPLDIWAETVLSVSKEYLHYR